MQFYVSPFRFPKSSPKGGSTTNQQHNVKSIIVRIYPQVDSVYPTVPFEFNLNGVVCMGLPNHRSDFAI